MAGAALPRGGEDARGRGLEAFGVIGDRQTHVSGPALMVGGAPVVTMSDQAVALTRFPFVTAARPAA
jgi:hypothetical protein